MNAQEIIQKLKGENYSNIFIWSDLKGTYYSWHTHPYEEIRVMLKGKMVINTKDKSVTLQKGDVLKVPPNEEHEAYVLEDSEYVCASKI